MRDLPRQSSRTSLRGPSRRPGFTRRPAGPDLSPAQHPGERFEILRSIHIPAGLQLQEPQPRRPRPFAGLGEHPAGTHSTPANSSGLGRSMPIST